MAEPVAFTYDGVEHVNDCNACHYTPLKGLIRWQENPTDWETLCTYYGLAAKLARAEWTCTCGRENDGQDENCYGCGRPQGGEAR